jgi:hypothetical protein
VTLGDGGEQVLAAGSICSIVLICGIASDLPPGGG